MRNWKIVTAFLALAGMGCATTATVSHDGEEDEVKILDSNSRQIRVSKGEQEYTIDKSSIRDIDHPGNVAAAIGALLTVYGVINIAVGEPKCHEKGAAFCTGVFTPAAVGLPLLVWGLIVWHGSTNAAGVMSPRSSASVAPFFAGVDGHNYTGAGLTLHY